jgi:hypothetical protein
MNLASFFARFVKSKAGRMPTPQELHLSCGVGILPAPSESNYYHFIYFHLLIEE